MSQFVVHQLSALHDNYVYVLRDQINGITGVIDPSEPLGVLEFLKQRGWNLDFIFNTHHHWDHVGGNAELKRASGCRIFCSEYDRGRIEGADEGLSEGQTVTFGTTSFRVLNIPGHTLGHIALWFEKEKAVFCGDTLFGSGCGRLFEGTPAQMWASLQRLAALPEETKVFCGHEYTKKNCEFAMTLDPDRADLQTYAKKISDLRAQGKSTVPTTMRDEKKFNPFVRAPNVEAFAQIRQLKDKF